MKFELVPAKDGKHKYVGIFTKETRLNNIKKVPFGAKNYEDYTTHKNPFRRLLYLARHRTRENWNDPMTPGSLSRYILWETPDLQKNIALFKERFKLN